jgi:hypothetical protein
MRRWYGRTVAVVLPALGAFGLIAFRASFTDARQAGLRSVPQQTTIVPRTPDGTPDLEGVWNFSTLTPLERPAAFASKSTFTQQEAAAFERETIASNDADRRDGPATTDVSRAYNQAWFDRGTHLAVVNGVRPTSLITDPPNGRIPPLTAEGQRRATAQLEARRAHPADGPEDRPLAERCLSFNAGPPMLSGPYNNYVQIFQRPERVVLLNEMIHDARIVPLDNRPHLPQTVRQFLGDSRGHWDGDTLVIDTTNFTSETSFHGSDDQLHLTEMLTRVDADTLLYSFTIDDPTAFTRRWTAVLPMKRELSQIYEYACHEGNYAMTGILRGARAEENQKR